MGSFRTQNFLPNNKILPSQIFFFLFWDFLVKPLHSCFHHPSNPPSLFSTHTHTSLCYHHYNFPPGFDSIPLNAAKVSSFFTNLKFLIKISKMKCFSFFSSKKRGKSSPELREENPSRKPTTRLVKSTGSIVSSPRSIPELYKEKGHNLRKFSFSELRNATNNFNRLLKIGEGGFGSVYKGSIKPLDGQGDPFAVAIKKLNRNGMQGHKEWLAEVQFLGVVGHPNLVKLLGYCSVDGERGIQRLLVYEYMRNKSLEDHLFGRALPPLTWLRRLKVLLDAAEGLTYLHEGLEIQVIFRDFKSSNMLLDENFNAKLSDFGLAREGPQGDQTHVSTRPAGTYGYAAPEYVETGHLKSNSDLWSFGVVLYEILSGRKAIDRNLPQPEQKLIEWVKQFPADGKRFRMIMDPRLNNQYSLGAARKVAKLADNCLRKNPDDRPTMSRIVEVLQEAIRESEDSSISETRSPLPEPSTRRMVHVS